MFFVFKKIIVKFPVILLVISTKNISELVKNNTNEKSEKVPIGHQVMERFCILWQLQL